jgi:hypothetical protein
MSLYIQKVCFVIDSPMNAMVAAILARKASQVDVIYALDPLRKDVEEYLRVLRALLSELQIHSESFIEIDSARFWGGKKNELLPDAREALAPLIKGHTEETVYFGNCLTNPVALALKHFVRVNHLYHAPGDFVHMLFPREGRLKSSLKSLIKNILGMELYKIEIGDFPIYSFLNLASQKNFAYLDFNEFSSKIIEDSLASLSQPLNASENNIMLLLAGDEPEPGDNNASNIVKYLKPHFQAVEVLINIEGLKRATLWIKEHKSYFPLSHDERVLLTNEFTKLSCDVRFVTDYLPKEYRSLPGECILRYGRVDYVVAEPSAFLFNIAGSSTIPAAAVSFFAPYRDEGQIGRNAEFIGINNLLTVPSRVY